MWHRLGTSMSSRATSNHPSSNSSIPPAHCIHGHPTTTTRGIAGVAIMSSHLFQQNTYPTQAYSSSEPLAFFGGGGSGGGGGGGSSSTSPYYAGSRSSLEGNMGGQGGGGGYATGSMASSARLGNMMAGGEGRWWEAFGTGGFEGEPSLMEGESRF